MAHFIPYAIAALFVDLAVGDPARLPHPVIGMGKLIGRTERLLRRFGSGKRRERALGMLLVAIVLAVTGALIVGVIRIAAWIHPILYAVCTIWFISTTIAFNGLANAAMDVYRPLVAGNLAEARRQVGRIVGRDTESLSPEEVVRATVETVAENIVDAAVSPVFYALIGGAPLAMLYRAVNTMDSMVGYKNETYLHFGWAAARLDDIANYVPARLTGGMLILIAWLSKGLSARGAWDAVRRDARKHPSPNSGFPEAAVAGALGVRLGGRNVYGGVISERATMGEPRRTLEPEDIRRSVHLLRLVAVLVLAILFLLWGLWGARSLW